MKKLYTYGLVITSLLSVAMIGPVSASAFGLNLGLTNSAKVDSEVGENNSSLSNKAHIETKTDLEENNQDENNTVSASSSANAIIHMGGGKSENKEKNGANGWNKFTSWFKTHVLFEKDEATSTTNAVLLHVNNIHVITSTSTATIQWNTNESAKGEIQYSMTNPISTSGTVVTDVTVSTDHSITLNNLLPGTVYFYVVTATDASGNVQHSEVRHFRTNGVVSDTKAPRIIFAFTFDTKATATRVIWFTNEPSDSRIWIGTSLPVSTSTAPIQSSTNLSFFHDLTVSGLATSTTYFYTITSTDVSGNTSAHTAGSFMTASM